jgi:uncharacterized membrane protein YhaH (DUF805 family)
MNLKSLLFSFRGRIHRKTYWLVALSLAVTWTGLAFSFAALDQFGQSPGGIALMVIGAIIFLAALRASIAISVKRLHDRNRSGWWLFLFSLTPGLLNEAAKSMDNYIVAIILQLAGAAISFWLFVELGCFRGTSGPNRFGPDPLAETPSEISVSA